MSNTFSDNEVRRIARVVLAYERSHNVPAFRRPPPISSDSGGNAKLIKTPGGGIAACTGSGPYTFGSATCTVVGDDGVVGSETIIVKNIVNVAIPAEVIGKANRVGSIWVIDVASCGA
jgi:hypothetical protein